jgi:ATP-dependent Clp protease ATP-binding subunit ClpC
MTLFERFTDRARRVLVLAQEEARLLNHSFIGTEHILLGLMDEGEGVAAKALNSLDIRRDVVFAKLQELGFHDGGTTPVGSPPFTPRVKKVLELALREALQLGHSYIGTEHILLGLVREGEGVGTEALVALGIGLGDVRAEVIAIMQAHRPPPDVISTLADKLGAEQPVPVDALTVYQLRQEIARLRDHNLRLKKALTIMAEGDLPHALALRKAIEAL